MSGSNQKWLKDYEAFLNADEAPVPTKVTDKVFSKMNELLNPSAWSVFVKVLGIHLVVGFLSLSICHQFEMNPFRTTASLSNWFMEMWGHSVCMIGCGVLFLSFSLLTAGYFLTIEEVKALKRTEFIQTLALGAISLSIFAFAGAELALTFGALWLLGALVGGFVATETIWKLKQVRV